MRNIKYYISCGQKAKMFTLRCSGDEMVGEEIREYDQHERSLSTDLEKAKAKATDILGYLPEVRVQSVGTITRGQVDHSVFPSGKYMDKSPADVVDDDQYLTWWYQNMTSKAQAKFRECLAGVLIEKELLCIDTDGSYVTKEYLDRELALKNREIDRLNKIKNAQYVGELGEIIELDATLIFLTGFDGRYGWTNIYNFEDMSGNVIVYMGSAGLGIDKGDKVKIKGRVKEQSVYNEIKQTKISHIKVVDCYESKDEQ